MGNEIKTLYNANVYADGVSYLGKAEEFTLPDLKSKMTEHKPLGNIGSFDLPTGLDKMTAKAKWNTVDKSIIKLSADFYNSHDIMVRANQDVWVNGSRVGTVPVIAQMRVMPKGVPPVGLKHQDNPDVETEFNVTAYKLDIDGETVIEVDLFAQVFILDGVDQYAEYRDNLGI